MTRYERIKGMSVEEMAEKIIALGFTDDYCKSDCVAEKFDEFCTPDKEKQCCIRWLNETEEKENV